jgi:menaquinone-dependent protoporphyrinogen oxidase
VTVLVAYATKHGSTEQIADTIGRELRQRGLAADVRSVGEIEDVARYEAVVLGSAVYVGHWLSNARAFANEHAAELADRPTWLFSSGPVGHPLRPTEEDAVQIEDVLEGVQPREHRVFPGKLDKSRLNCCEWALVFALRVKEGDYRNDGEVSTWASEIAAEIAASLEPQPSSIAQPSSSPSSSA